MKPRIYVACLAAQLEGAAHGAWVEVDGDVWQLWEGVRNMLLASPSEQADAFFIGDHEGFCGKLRSDASLDAVLDLAQERGLHDNSANYSTQNLHRQK